MLITPSILGLSTLMMLCLVLPIISASKYGLLSMTGEPLRLIKLSSRAIFEGPYAHIDFIETYRNPFDKSIETEYLFPRTESSIFHSFKATFRGKTIVGQIMEKEKAQNLYEESIKNGSTAAYSDRNIRSPDVMNVKVGNIPAGESVEIRFSIIQPLEVIGNKFWSLALPVVLSDLHSLSTGAFTSSNASNTNSSEGMMPLPNDWEVYVEVNIGDEFELIYNPSHKLEPILSQQASGNYSKVSKAIWDVELVPNKNFVVYFKPKNIQAPTYILAEHKNYSNDYVLLVDFVPELNTLSIDGIIEALNDKDEGLSKLYNLLLNQQKKAKAEFIFIIDRSQSMNGARLTNLKTTLRKFFDNLPTNSYFNIISFGSWTHMYRNVSVKTTPFQLVKVIRWLEWLNSDYGGTEMLGPMNKAVSLPDIDNYPRVVILITDGDIFNPDGVIKIARDNSPRIRFFTVSIGNGVSDYLLKNVAKEGNGISEFVLDDEDIGYKARYMIESATSEYIKDIELKVDCYNAQKSLVKNITKKIDILVKDQSLKEWVYLQGQKDITSCTVNLKYLRSDTGSIISQQIVIDDFKYRDVTDFWHKVAYDAKIKELDSQIIYNENVTNTTVLKSQIIDISTKYQVLSDYTAFFAVLEENTVENSEGTITEPVENPGSVDCNLHGGCSNLPENGSNNPDQTDTSNHSPAEGNNREPDESGANTSIEVVVPEDYGGNSEPTEVVIQEPPQEYEEAPPPPQTLGLEIREKTADGRFSVALDNETNVKKKIETIYVRRGLLMDALMIVFDDNTATYLGGDGGGNLVFNLEEGENIIEVSGRYDYSYLLALIVKTDKGRVFQFNCEYDRRDVQSFSFKFNSGEYLSAIVGDTNGFNGYTLHTVLESLTFVVKKEDSSNIEEDESP